MSRVARLAPAALLAFATVALPFATAVPASATVEACADHLSSMGYQVLYTHEEACWQGSVGEFERCVEDLKTVGVWRYHAYDACLLAAKE